MTQILDREVAGSRPPRFLCFFIYRFTGAGVEVGDTQSAGGEGRLGPTKVRSMYGVSSNCGD